MLIYFNVCLKCGYFIFIFFFKEIFIHQCTPPPSPHPLYVLNLCVNLLISLYKDGPEGTTVQHNLIQLWFNLMQRNVLFYIEYLLIFRASFSP